MVTVNTPMMLLQSETLEMAARADNRNLSCEILRRFAIPCCHFPRGLVEIESVLLPQPVARPFGGSCDEVELMF